jgi:hypothetical protein
MTDQRSPDASWDPRDPRFDPPSPEERAYLADLAERHHPVPPTKPLNDLILADNDLLD